MKIKNAKVRYVVAAAAVLTCPLWVLPAIVGLFIYAMAMDAARHIKKLADDTA